MEQLFSNRPRTLLEYRVAQEQNQVRAAARRSQHLTAELLAEKYQAEKAENDASLFGVEPPNEGIPGNSRTNRFTFMERLPYSMDRHGMGSPSEEAPLVPRSVSIGEHRLHLAYIDAGDHWLLRAYGQGLRPDGEQFYGLAGLPAFGTALVYGDSAPENDAMTGVYVENPAPEWVPRYTTIGEQPHYLVWLSDQSIKVLRAHGQGYAPDGSQRYGPGGVPAFFGSTQATDEMVTPQPRPEANRMITPQPRPEPRAGNDTSPREQFKKSPSAPPLVGLEKDSNRWKPDLSSDPYGPHASFHENRSPFRNALFGNGFSENPVWSIDPEKVKKLPTGEEILRKAEINRVIDERFPKDIGLSEEACAVAGGVLGTTLGTSLCPYFFPPSAVVSNHVCGKSLGVLTGYLGASLCEG